MIQLAPPADQRVLRGVAATLRWQPLNGDGVAFDPGSVTVAAVRDSDGSEALASTNATGSAAAERTVTLPAAANQNLDRLTVTWSVSGTPIATTVVEVVGRYYLTVAQLRAIEALKSTTAYPDQAFVDAIAEVEQVIEWATGVAWVPRYRRDTFTGTGQPVLQLARRPRTVRSITVDGTAQDVDDWVFSHTGRLIRVDETPVPTSDPGGIEVVYEHGYDAPDHTLRRAALRAAQYRLLGDKSQIDPRATGMANDYGNVTYAIASEERPFGIPDVDAIIRAHSERTSGIG